MAGPGVSRTGRYWIFFVIVATGLALSWTQVGRKAQHALSERAVVYLLIEDDCRPWQAPCAALADDRALVLGPAVSGLLLKATGIEHTAVIAVHAQLLAADGVELSTQQLVERAGGWQIPLPPHGAERLRITLETGVETSAAEFPLVAGVRVR